MQPLKTRSIRPARFVREAESSVASEALTHTNDGNALSLSPKSQKPVVQSALCSQSQAEQIPLNAPFHTREFPRGEIRNEMERKFPSAHHPDGSHGYLLGHPHEAKNKV